MLTLFARPMPLSTSLPTPRPRAHRGFTLVELLAVIAIIGVLAAIIMLGTARMRASAHSARCAENLRQISQALFMSTADNRGAFPPGHIWDRSIAPYIGTTLSASPTATPPTSLLICPSDSRTLASPRSYVVPAQSNSYPGVGIFSRSPTLPSLRLPEISHPPQTILVTEFYTGGWASSAQFNTAYSAVDGWLGVGGAPVLDDGSPYHRSGQNYAFCDGHVERLSPAQVVISVGSSTGGHWRAY